MFRLRTGLGMALLFVVGCLYPVHDRVDRTVCDLALQPRDLPSTPPGQSPLSQQHEIPDSSSADKDTPRPPGKKPAQELPPPKGVLQIPEGLMPGGNVPPIKLPPPTPENESARKRAIEDLFPPLPSLGEDRPYPLGPEGKPLGLTELQRLALANSPLIKQATAKVEEIRGQAIQAGLAPNPMVGFESDTVGTTGGAGYVGGFVEQTVKTANKLQLARSVSMMELRKAELELFKAQADLATQVRNGYFAVLVAEEAVRVKRALVQFTTDVYQIQLEQVRRGGFAAPYEPMYLRVLALQARAALVQARNRRTAAWKQLAAVMGLPGMPPTQLVGRLDVPIPAYDHQTVLAKVLAQHTDVRVAEASLIQARYRLELERRTPIPDVNLRVMLQKDRTGPPFQASPSVAVSLPVPVFDANQGNILAAQAAILRIGEEMHQARNELTNRLAEAFERYENNRILIIYYRDQILPDLVRVYRGVYDRYQREPAGAAGSPPGFAEVVVAQQNLAEAISNYVSTLGSLWQAVVDVADLLQTFDLFGVAEAHHPVPAIPDLNHLPPLPCTHPCSPIPHGHQRVLDGSWPPADLGTHPRTPPPTLPVPREQQKQNNKSSVPLPVEKPITPATFDPLLLEPPPTQPASDT